MEKLADAAMKDPEYVAMIADLENGTELKEIDKTSELAKIQDHWKYLSTKTLKGGKVLILKDNVEIMIPKAERQNILNLAHRTHLGEHMMQKQLRGRVFWCNMARDIKTMVRDCDPCNRFHRSHPHEKVEVSHGSMFDIFAGHTVHSALRILQEQRLLLHS